MADRQGGPSNLDDLDNMDAADALDVLDAVGDIDVAGIPPEQLAWDRDEVAHVAAAYGAGLDVGLSAGYAMGLSMGSARVCRHHSPDDGKPRRHGEIDEAGDGDA